MQTVNVNLGPRSYSIRIGARNSVGWPAFLRECCPTATRAFFVADTHTEPLMRNLKDAAGIPAGHGVVPAGEWSKCLEQFSFLLDRLADFNADRKTPVIAVGGGVVGDLAGFAAAAYNRGLPFIQVPTTLLAMVDSSVGGKVGINHAKGKNLIGAFHQPAGVWIDIALLDTLPDREFLSGLAEVVKYGIIQDPRFFEFLETNAAKIRQRDPEAIEHVVARSCRLKANVVEQDEREETGLRMILNYGHTFAHAFETVGGYGTWLHGEAVAAGMVCASRLAEKRGLVHPELTERQIRVLQAFDLPTVPLKLWNIEAMVAVMKRDKKAEAGRLRFILPTRLGEVKLFDDLFEEQVRNVLLNGGS